METVHKVLSATEVIKLLEEDGMGGKSLIDEAIFQELETEAERSNRM